MNTFIGGRLPWILGGAVVGFFLEELTDGLEQAAYLSSWIATGAAIYFGTKVLSVSLKHGQALLSSTIIAIWIANLAFSFNVEPEPVVDMLFDLATILSMMFFAQCSSKLDRE